MYVYDERVNQYERYEERMKDPFDSLMLIDFMVTELCNRDCTFCPRSTGYPNLNLHMSLSLVRKISDELSKLYYANRVLYCGFGEPLLYKDLIESINILRTKLPWNNNFHLVTNGDKLDVPLAKELVKAGLNRFYVSLYDGEHQVQEFTELFSEAGLNNDQYFLQHYYLPEESNFGFLHLSNRAGWMYKQTYDAPCNIPFYAMSINYNGKVLLCSHDWTKSAVVGDLKWDSIDKIWLESRELWKYRKACSQNERTIDPCKHCNIKGVLYGNKSKEILNDLTP